MTIRFDADKDKPVRGAHPYDKAERGGDGWTRDAPETLWYLTDGNSNGRWLYVDKPDEEGHAEVGIARVYRKHLSPAALRSLAAALVQAAGEGEAIAARLEADRAADKQREAACAADGGHQWGPPPLTVTHATAVATAKGSSSFWVCTRCGHGEWLGDTWPASPVSAP